MALTIVPINLLTVSSSLNLETPGATTTTSLLKFATLRPDEGLDTIVGMGIVDGGSLTEVSQGLATGRSAQQDSVGTRGCPQGELVEGEALSTSCDDTLASILSEGKSADTHLGAFEHTDIIGDLTNNYSDLAVLVGHVLGKTMEANRRRVDLGHVQTLGNGGAELGVCSAGEEFV